MPKYLIINADDYGMSQSTNEAVEDLFDNGWITSTTLMTPCPWAEDGVARAKRNPNMRVGLHTTLTSEWGVYRWGPVARTPVGSLLDDAGYLPQACAPLLARATKDDVRTELHAQMNFMVSRGLLPTHVDNHMGSVYGLEGPQHLDVIFELCAPRKLAFRMPRTTEGFGEVPPALEAQVGALVAAADAHGVGLLDRMLSFSRPITGSDTYETVRDEYIALLGTCVEGVNEMYMHPALETAELKAIMPGWRWQMRVWEHRLLKDPALRDAIDAAGLVMTTWVDAPFAKG